MISGGGSGHEPMHGGFVGMGMLDAACPGEVFTSPTPDQMLEATKAVDGGAGVLHIVKNYTGDVLNFEMAADLARAKASRSRRSSSTTTSRCKTASTRRAAAASGRPCWPRRSRGAAAEDGQVAGPWPRCGEGQRQRPHHGHGVDVVHRARRRPSRRSSSATTRWRSASASTANPAASAAAGAGRIVDRLASAILDDLPFSGRHVLAFVNGMGGTPLSSCTSSTTTCSCLEAAGSRSAAT